MVITEGELREAWRNGRGALPAYPPGTRLTPAAQDFLKDHGLTLQFAEPPAAPPEPSQPPAQPTPSTAYLLARLDSLNALAMLAAAEARQYRLPKLAERLDPLAAQVAGWRVALLGGQPLPPPPPDTPGLAAFPPIGPTDHAMLHWLNLLRATAKEAEVLAAEQPLRPHLHRLGHELADLALGFQGGPLGWQVTENKQSR